MGDEGTGRRARLTTSVPPDVAAVYRDAAAALGKSVAQVVREVLEEGVRDVVATVAVTERVAAGESGAAATVYFRLARAREAEAMDAMIQANTLMLASPPSGAAVRK